MNKQDIEKIVIDKLDIGSLSEVERRPIIEKLGENILKRIFIAVFDKLPEEDREEFKNLTEGGDVDNLYKIIESKISDPDTLINDTINKTIEEFKEIQRNL